MASTGSTYTSTRLTGEHPTEPTRLYAKLEGRIMERDQVGDSEAYYDLVRAGRPLTEIASEAVRIHALYTQTAAG
jgi:hypothetical protein